MFNFQKLKKSDLLISKKNSGERAATPNRLSTARQGKSGSKESVSGDLQKEFG
jgi:hypothetical protein